MSLKYKKRVGQKILRAKYKRSHYKTIDGYLNQVYENNKGYIDMHMEDYGTKKQRKAIFKNQVKELLTEINPDTGRKFTINQAIDKVQRSEAIRTPGERGFEVMMSNIKETSKDSYKKLRMELGWKNKIQSEKSSYVGFEDNYYIYRYYNKPGNVVYIKIRISPPNADGSMDIQVVKENEFLNKLKMPKWLQDQYTNVKTKEQQQVAEQADKAVREILERYGMK